jgi:two-component system, cell cycle sensor histidine kinase and response regulator CckA
MNDKSLAIKLSDRQFIESEFMVQLLDDLTDGYVSFDAWRFSFLSPKGREFMNLTDEMIGLNIWEQFPLLVQSGFQLEALRAVQEARTINVTELCPYTDRWIENYIRPCANGVNLFFKDITALLKSSEKQERFKAVLEATTDFVCITDSRGRPTFLNSAGRRMIGLTESDDVSNTQFHPKEVSDQILNVGLPIAWREGVWTGETALITRENKIIPVLQVTIAHKDQNQQVSYFSTIARDISEQKKTENRLRQQAALLDLAPDAIIVCDLDFNITFWNNGAIKIYEWARADVIGQNLNSILFASIDEALVKPKLDFLSANGKWEGEFRHFTKSGDQVRTECHWRLIRDNQDKAHSYLFINTDVTEKKQLEEQIYRTQRMESILTLASGIAHDLNNVLAPILLATRILHMRLQDDDSRQLIDTLQRSAERGADLIKQVLSYARGASGDKNPVLIEPLILEMVGILTDTMPRTIRFELQCSNQHSLVLGDGTQLYQVLMNLCVNAKDSMPDGGVIAISTRETHLQDQFSPFLAENVSGDFVVIEVTDTGHGIEPKVRDKIFEPFFTTKPLGQGTGLGLSTVQGIVKGHNGFVSVKSEINLGTTFEVYLPKLAKPFAVQEKAKASTELKGNGQSVLIVDDENEVLLLTNEILKEYGFQPKMALGGAQAIHLIRDEGFVPELAIIDLMMPKIDGLTTIEELRKLLPNLKIIITSGLADDETIKHALANNLADFLPKPSLPTEIFRLVNSLIGKSA